MKILVIDDFLVVRLSLRNALKRLGYTNVDEAADGRSGLQKIEKALADKAPFDLVFRDWNMPEVSGPQVIEACRAQAGLRDLPIVIVTAEGEGESIVRAMGAGATDYILKPISSDILEKCLTKIVAERKLPA